MIRRNAGAKSAGRHVPCGETDGIGQNAKGEVPGNEAAEMTMNRIDQADILRQGALGRFPETGRQDRSQGVGSAAQTPGGSERVEDRAEISEAARRLMEVHGALEVGREAVQELPDVRAERVAEAKQHLAQGYYRSVEVQAKVAEGVGRVMEGMDAL